MNRLASASRSHNYLDHNYAGHKCRGRNYAGHVYIGHNYIGHNYIGHNYIGEKLAGIGLQDVLVIGGVLLVLLLAITGLMLYCKRRQATTALPI